MVRYSLRIPNDLHEKIRWLAYTERRSQHSIILEILEKNLEGVEPPLVKENESDRRTNS